MTTVTDSLPRPLDASVGRRPHVNQRFLAGFAVGALAALGVVGAAVLAYDAIHDGRVLPGVHAGAVDLSALDRQQAAAALTAGYDGYGDGQVVVRTEAGDVSIPYREFSRRPDIDAMIDAAMAVGRSGTLIERAIAEPKLAVNGVDVAPRVAFDQAALASRIAASVEAMEREPTDATITMGDRGIVTTRARPGLRFDTAAAERAALTAVAQPDAPAQVVVHPAAISVPPTIDDADVQAAKKAAGWIVTDVVIKHGTKTFTIPAATVQRWVRFEPTAQGSVAPAVDASQIPPALDPIAKPLVTKPVSATYLVGQGGTTVGVAAGKDGERLDVVAMAAAIRQALVERAHGASPAPIPAVMVAVAPELTTAEAQKQAPLMVRLSSWKTWFPISERNHYGANIWLPARFINGTVLQPGERFEWFDAVGPITTARGFGRGGVIVGDHTEPTGAIGGGMCSSSTTLFNAALRAGLKMGARANHSYYIDRYPLGLDATVTIKGGSTTTMSFTNDMDHPILIRGFKVVGSGGKGWVRYEIWGVPDGRTVSIGKAVVTNLMKATTKTFPVTTLKKGVRRQTEYPSNGMDVSVTRVVRDRDGNVIHQERFRSHYKKWNGRIEVGA